jgi:hypothetical protein
MLEYWVRTHFTERLRWIDTDQTVIANEVKVETTHVPRIRCGVLAMTIYFFELFTTYLVLVGQS